MKDSKNFRSAGSAVMMLFVSFVLSAPRATNGYESKLSRTAKPFAVARESTLRSPESGRSAARPVLANYSISQATEADTADDLSIDASFGDEQIVLERKKHRRQGCICHVVVISIIGVLVGKPSAEGGPLTVDLRATISGPDAVRGSLLYGLAWLAEDPDPLRAVQALGYDIEVTKEHDRPCTDGPSSNVCVERARRLATLVDATLALRSPDERALFQKGASALGVAPDCSAAATTRAAAVPLASSLDRPADLLIDASVGDHEIALTRSGGDKKVKYMEIKLKEVIVTTVGNGPPKDGQSVALNVRITGPDMIPGSLLYALAWLAGQPDPLGSVRALGYDIAADDQRVHSCSDQRGGYTCEEEAHRLATLLDATLALGIGEERAQFRRDASVIGIAPDCSLRKP